MHVQLDPYKVGRFERIAGWVPETRQGAEKLKGEKKSLVHSLEAVDVNENSCDLKQGSV